MSHTVILAWMLSASGYAFGLFAYDKWRAGRPGARRVAELHLLAASALGGWPGALAAMLLFRHKTAKASFILKFAIAFLVWMLLVWLCLTRPMF